VKLFAQAEASNGHAPVKYWLHANMLTLNGKKMAKSTGNSLLPDEIFSGDNDILSKSFSPAVVRFFMMQAHYTSILDISNDALLASEKGFSKLMEAMDTLQQLETTSSSDFDVSSWEQRCYHAMNDDFNTPILIANLFEAVKHINLVKEGKEKLTQADRDKLTTVMHSFTFDILGIENVKTTGDHLDTLTGVVQLLIQLRNDARSNKDFATSDKIRDELAALGVQLKDGKDGTTFSVAK